MTVEFILACIIVAPLTIGGAGLAFAVYVLVKYSTRKM